MSYQQILSTASSRLQTYTSADNPHRPSAKKHQAALYVMDLIQEHAMPANKPQNFHLQLNDLWRQFSELRGGRLGLVVRSLQTSLSQLPGQSTSNQATADNRFAASLQASKVSIDSYAAQRASQPGQYRIATNSVAAFFVTILIPFMRLHRSQEHKAMAADAMTQLIDTTTQSGMSPAQFLNRLRVLKRQHPAVTNGLLKNEFDRLRIRAERAAGIRQDLQAARLTAASTRASQLPGAVLAAGEASRNAVSAAPGVNPQNNTRS